MDPLGPGGETIIDYSIYDAVHSGFGKVVYIVREYFLEQFKAAAEQKYRGVRCPDGSPLELAFVTQELDKIPAGYSPDPGRQKPWGTAHAVLMARDVIDGPFVVINGDDYYGRESFALAAQWCMKHEGGSGRYAIVGFELDNTLSKSGGVSRGICHYDAQMHLTDVVEHHNIALGADGKVTGDNSVSGQKVTLQGKALCSMNMWCFTPDYFPRSEGIFRTFLDSCAGDPKKEFYIPYAVDVMIRSGEVSCEVIPTPSRWFGVTFKEDRPDVVAKFAALAADGIYPTPLYGKQEAAV